MGCWYNSETMTSHAAKPSAGLVAGCTAATFVSMAAGLYFGGSGNMPIALTGTALFILFGGLTFELARRRSS